MNNRRVTEAKKAAKAVLPSGWLRLHAPRGGVPNPNHRDSWLRRQRRDVGITGLQLFVDADAVVHFPGQPLQPAPC